MVALRLDLLSSKLDNDLVAACENVYRTKRIISLLERVSKNSGGGDFFYQSVQRNLNAQRAFLDFEKLGVDALRGYKRYAEARCTCSGGKVKCPKCRGKGEVRNRLMCTECDGSGWFRTYKCPYCVGGYAWSDPAVCMKCNGLGWIVHGSCEGTGRRHYKKIKGVLSLALPEAPRKKRARGRLERSE